jgi:hypothetical protein
LTAFTLVIAYYENRGMLQRQYENLRRFPSAFKAQMNVIIVDDGSPNNPAWGEPIDMPLSVYRIGVDVRWNQDACRNIGVHHAETDWLLLTDMDHYLAFKTVKYLTENKFDGRNAYKFTRLSEPELTDSKSHPNSWFMTKALYDRLGGYDERFAGYYGTDADFKNRLSKIAKIFIIDKPLVRVPREVTPDASTTTYQRKTPEDSEGMKRVYAERAACDDQRPKRLTFPYKKVWPC